MPDPAPGPEATVLQREQAAQLRRALEQLRPEQRQILTLRSMQGLSYEEIGQCLGLRAGTVKSRLARAREQLRRALEEAGTKRRQRRLRKQKGGNADAMQKANRLLSEKLDGMLSPRENAALAKHLDQCPACRRRLTDYMQLDAALADLEKEPACGAAAEYYGGDRREPAPVGSAAAAPLPLGAGDCGRSGSGGFVAAPRQRQADAARRK